MLSLRWHTSTQKAMHVKVEWEEAHSGHAARRSWTMRRLALRDLLRWRARLPAYNAVPAFVASQRIFGIGAEPGHREHR
jgi:hypothetical protein